MSTSLNVIALISGGKDSLFSILHCLANNHRVIALANLYPPSPPSGTADDDDPDLNSYMYQTVGHTLLPLYATALSLPLYRQEIVGAALTTEKDYDYDSSAPSPSPAQNPDTHADADPRDETESLVPLLRRVVATHPQANALSTGAILSTYQRTRIESVAVRLGLVPLSYLWRYPELPREGAGAGAGTDAAGLLHDMAAVGLDARIVKVASGGLDESFLWERVVDGRVVGRLERAVERFGGSVLGEGGEYETLVVDGPEGMWRGRIEVGEEGKRIVRGGGGEAWVRFEGGRVVEKESGKGGMGDWRERLRIPGLWDERFEELLGELEEQEVQSLDACAVDKQPSLRRPPWRAERSIIRSDSMLTISNMTPNTSESSIEQQMVRISKDLGIILHENDHSFDDIVFTTILLRTMVDFSNVNAAYAQLFSKPNPPARVTVACGDTLPDGADIILSVVVDLAQRQHRKGLHVQSRSYWAPANIGPYSQAITVPLSQETTASLVYIAGQIPLIPASMEVLQTKTKEEDSHSGSTIPFQRQAVLALQHLWRIGKVVDVAWWTGAVAYITGGQNVRGKAMIAWLAWEKAHKIASLAESPDDDQTDEFDAWDRKYGGGQSSFFAEEVPVPQLPDFTKVTYDDNQNQAMIPSFLAVEVDELPRGCDIEWQSLGIAHDIVRLGISSVAGLQRQSCTTVAGHVSMEYLSIPSGFDDQSCLFRVREALREREMEGLEGNARGVLMHATLYTPSPGLFGRLKAQVVPCRSVWGAGGVRLAVALVLHSRTSFGP